MIHKIKTNDNIDRFDKKYDHSHFICLKCNKIIDFYKTFKHDEYLDDNKVLNCNVIFEGICKVCLEKEK